MSEPKPVIMHPHGRPLNDDELGATEAFRAQLHQADPALVLMGWVLSGELPKPVLADIFKQETGLDGDV